MCVYFFLLSAHPGSQGLDITLGLITMIIICSELTSGRNTIALVNQWHIHFCETNTYKISIYIYIYIYIYIWVEEAHPRNTSHTYLSRLSWWTLKTAFFVLHSLSNAIRFKRRLLTAATQLQSSRRTSRPSKIVFTDGQVVEQIQTTCSSKILSNTFSYLMICLTKRRFETICSSGHGRLVYLLMWKRLMCPNEPYILISLWTKSRCFTHQGKSLGVKNR